VGQPGESTTLKASNLTSDGISGLLNSEFAKEDTAEKPGQETPPDAEAVTETHESQDGENAEAAAEQPQQEEQPEAKADGEGEQQDGADLSPEMQTALDEWEAKGGALPDSLQRVVNKRIGRLTADKETATRRAETAEAALKTLQAEAEQLRNDPNRPAQPGTFGIPNEKELATAERSARKFLDNAEAYLDESATPEERTKIERFMEANGLDAMGLKRQVRQINSYLRDELPQQRQRLQTFRTEERAAGAQAQRDFPWLADPKAPEQQVKATMLRLLPDLPTRLPNHDLVIGIYMLGYKAYQQQLAAANGKGGKPAAKTPPPKIPAGNRATRTATAMKPKPSDAASAAFSKVPSRDNAVELARAALAEA
jgi:hypothetical protein